MLFLVTTGLNEEEFLKLRVHQINEFEDRAEVVVTNTNGQERHVLVPEETIGILRRNLSERRRRVGVIRTDDILFVRVNGESYSARSLYRLVARLLAQAGVETRTGSMVHLLRRTYVARAKRSGTSVQQLHEFLGHESKRSTERLFATL